MPRTVLICDDEPVLGRLVCDVLQTGASSILDPPEGHESLEVARGVLPDLDPIVPKRSGPEVLAELRGQEKVAGTPAIALGARAQAGDREAARRTAAAAFSGDAFSPLELLLAFEQPLSEGR